MRIGYAQSDRGEISEVCLPPSWLGLIKRADDLRSIRDQRLNDLKAQDKRFAQLKSPQSVQKLVDREGIEPDEALKAWLKQELHLWQYETGCRRRITAVRRDILAVWVRSLRRQYALVVLKDTQHKLLKEKSKKDMPQPARRQGHHGAPGETVERIRQVFGPERMAIVAAKNTTATCPACGHINTHGGERVVACENCGVDHDRDLISTTNMLRVYRKGDWKGPTVRKTSARWAEKHKKAA